MGIEPFRVRVYTRSIYTSDIIDDISIADVTKLLMNLGSMDALRIEVNGNKRFFNPAHIVWVEIVKENE